MIEGFDRSHAVLIGIDRYERVRPLRTPVSDATALAGILEQQHGFEALVVPEDKSTLVGLRRALSDLEERVGPNDRVLFYFAGHGIALQSDDGPKGYLLPQDASPTDEATFLGMVELQEALEELPCRHMLVVLDCCFAGALRWASYRDLAIASGPLHEKRYRWYVEGNAWQAIASAAHNEKALDVVSGNAIGERSEEAGCHSPFAKALIEGLQGAADYTDDGVITATELHVFLDDRLRPKEGSADRPQTPLSWLLKRHDRGQFLFLVPGRDLGLQPAPTLTSDTNPWRGLAPYEAKHRELFFGRDQAIQALVDLVMGRDESGSGPANDPQPFVVVTGPSGIGKSSLVRAGVLPKLRKETKSVVMRPEKDPFESLLLALRGNGVEANVRVADAEPCARLQRWWASGELARRQEARRDLQRGPSHAYQQRMGKWLSRYGGGGRLLLVIDQAEELFTMSDRSKAEAFIGMLAIALEEAGDRLQVIVTLRAEFEPQFVDSALQSRWQEARYIVPQMTQNELRRVIELSASAKVMRFEDDTLVDQLINEVVNMPGGLPMLSFALSEMYREYLERDDEDRTLTWADYDALKGGVIGALRVRANQIIDDLDAARRATARRVLERLVSVESTEFARRRVPRNELAMADPAENERVEKVIDQLLAARLIVTDEVGGEAYLELAHDALITSWPQLLAWVKNDLENIIVLRRLTASAKQWAEAGKAAKEALWPDPTRQQQLDTLERASTPGMNKQEAEFAKASQRRARRNRNIRTAVGASLVALTIIAVIGGVAAFMAREEAVAQRDEAIVNRSRLLANLSEQHDPDVSSRVPQLHDYTTAALLADEALGAIGQEPRDKISERALYQSLMQNAEIAVLGGHKHRVEAIAVSPSGRRVAAASLDRTVRVWSGFNYNDVIVLQHETAVEDALFTDEDTIVTVDNDGTIAVWDIPSLTIVDRLEGITGRLISSVAGSGLLAVARLGESEYVTEVDLYNTETLSLIRSISIPSDENESIASLHLSPSGKLVAIGRWDGTLFVWRTEDGELIHTRQFHDRVNAIRIFDNDRKVLVTIVDGPTIYDLGEGDVSDHFRNEAGQSMDTAIDEENGLVAQVTWTQDAGEFSGLLHLKDLSTGQQLSTMAGHLSYLTSVEFIPGQKLVATGSADGTVRLWSTELQPNVSAVRGPEGWNPIFLRFAQSNDQIFAVWSFGPDEEKMSELWLIDARDLAVLKKIQIPEEVQEAELCAKKNLIVLVTGNELLVIDGTTFEAKRQPINLEARVSSFATDAKCERVVLADSSGVTYEGSLAASGKLKAIPISIGTITGIEFSPVDRKIAVGSADGAIELYNLVSGARNRLTGHTEAVVHIEFSNDGKRLLSSTSRRVHPFRDPQDVDYDHSIRIWDAETGLEMVRFEHNERINIAKFAQDGRHVLSADDTALQIWRIDNGLLVGSLDAHSTDLKDAIFTNGTNRLVTQARNMMDERDPIRVWDMKLQAVVAEVRGHTGWMNDLDVNENGTLVAYSIWRDNVIRIVQIFRSPEDLRLAARRNLPRCLTLEQRRNFGLSPIPPTWCLTHPTGRDHDMQQGALWPYTTEAWRHWSESGAFPDDAPKTDASSVSSTGSYLFSSD